HPRPARPAEPGRAGDPAAAARALPGARPRGAPAGATRSRLRYRRARGRGPIVTVLTLITEPLQYDFMVRALVTTIIAASVSAVLSCWLVLVGWSLIGDAVSHSVLPGVALAYIFGLPFAVGAVVF